MKMVATWFRSRRGLAIGTVVAALTVGKATPYLVRVDRGRGRSRRSRWRRRPARCRRGAAVAFGYRDGPYAFARARSRGGSRASVVAPPADGGSRSAATSATCGSCTRCGRWIALFFRERCSRAGDGVAAAGALGFAVIAAGGAGAVLAGVWADRLGRERVAIWSMVVSGACALAIGWLLDAPLALLLPLALVWGFAIVADSAQFSALVTEVAPQHAVGTALTLQTSLGFALTALSIAFTVEVAERYGWGVAFAQLAIGPALGIIAMLRLARSRASVA